MFVIVVLESFLAVIGCRSACDGSILPRLSLGTLRVLSVLIGIDGLVAALGRRREFGTVMGPVG